MDFLKKLMVGFAFVAAVMDLILKLVVIAVLMIPVISVGSLVYIILWSL